MGKIFKTRRRVAFKRRVKKSWQIQEAKSKFSKLIEIVQEEGMQKITKNGKEVAVLLSQKEFEELKQNKESFLDFFREAPCSELDLDIQRSTSPSREIEL